MRQKVILLFIFLFSFGIFSCDETNDLIPVGSMEATVDGSAWKALTRVTIHESGYFNITGTSAAGDIVNILIMGDTEGSYSLDLSVSGVEAQVGGVYKPAAAMSDSDNYVVTKATVVLTDVNSRDKKISGTFELEVTKTEGTTIIETLEITNGEFENLKYTET
jgi:uncharacterized protein DUF6252